ncbi:hypothetical protein GP486_002219 [Trichoglossum hirsutum]|uniref:Histidine acid phosphatase n=1 Tax=Trichoglossum hirsutum TaxID=265104 RepID=A0A9P8LF76_9PEZI|nr:hypothetical protein GP486_002219 [Trichoglossum hirsutum]
MAIVSYPYLPSQHDHWLANLPPPKHSIGTSKHYWNYHITSLGLTQNFLTGSYYHDRYLFSNSTQRILGISSTYSPSLVPSRAPDQQILINTATAFLQGLYPPSADAETISNGSSIRNPLGGYQYVSVHADEASDEDMVWLKGTDQCPAYTAAAAEYSKSAEFAELLESTRRFYGGFKEALKGVWDYTNPATNLTYANAYDIFDLLNVASIHNASTANLTTPTQLAQLRTLADGHEFALTYNSSNPARSIGGKTFIAMVLSQLNNTVATQGQQGKFSLMAGSYNTFQAFFALANLTAAKEDFFGLPGYASTMAFELFTEKNTSTFPSNVADLNVRFLFRNGTEQGPLMAYPLFGGQSLSMSWADFKAEMSKRSISTVEEWCKECKSTVDFCAKFQAQPHTNAVVEKKGVSNVVAGVAGAMVMLGIVLVLGVVFLLVRRAVVGKKRRVTVARDKEGSLGS